MTLIRFTATMNPMDRGADQVDAAFERRFAKIAMEPNVKALEDILDHNGMDDDLKRRVIRFFNFLMNHPNQHARIGHAYFIHAKDEESLKRLWDHQLKFHLQRAFQLLPEDYQRVEANWQRVLSSSSSENAAQAASAEPQARESEEAKD